MKMTERLYAFLTDVHPSDMLLIKAGGTRLAYSRFEPYEQEHPDDPAGVWRIGVCTPITANELRELGWSHEFSNAMVVASNRGYAYLAVENEG